MRGRQVGAALRAEGWDVTFRVGPSAWALRGVRNSIVLCVKSPPRDPLLRLRGNLLVLDAVDYRAWMRPRWGVQAVVAATEDMRRRLEIDFGSQVRVETIYHHADPGLERQHAPEDQLRLAYVGEPNNSLFIGGQVPGLETVNFRKGGWRGRLRDYNAHFSARVDPNKSVVKLANVAALGAVFLTGPEPGCVELLGEDYPFFLRNHRDLETVREDVETLRSAVGQATWIDARERIESIRDRLSVAGTAKAYTRLLESF